MKINILLLMLVLLALSCNKQTTEPVNELFTVKGTLVNNQGPIAKATVSVDSAINWTAQSDDNGNFTINNVSKGSHTLTYKKTYENSTYVVRSDNIQVNDDIVLNSLKLPLPTSLYQPDSISISSILLEWNQTDAEDFREYKLYRHNTPGLDELTGELIYVGTNRQDTLFQDTDLASGGTYYYRIYILNEFGKLGGSNIVSQMTAKGNLVPDGDFESGKNIFLNWGLYSGSADFSYSDSVKKSGNYSLQGKLINNGDVRLTSLTTCKLAAGVTYTMSGWLKANGITQGTYEFLMFYIQDNNGFYEEITAWVGVGIDLSKPVDIEWIYVTKTFTPTTDVTVFLGLYCGIENFWFDDLKLVAQ